MQTKIATKSHQEIKIYFDILSFLFYYLIINNIFKNNNVPRSNLYLCFEFVYNIFLTNGMDIYKFIEKSFLYFDYIQRNIITIFI